MVSVQRRPLNAAAVSKRGFVCLRSPARDGQTFLQQQADRGRQRRFCMKVVEASLCFGLVHHMSAYQQCRAGPTYMKRITENALLPSLKPCTRKSPLRKLQTRGIEGRPTT